MGGAFGMRAVCVEPKSLHICCREGFGSPVVTVGFRTAQFSEGSGMTMPRRGEVKVFLL